MAPSLLASVPLLLLGLQAVSATFSPTGLDCQPDNCLREVEDARFSSKALEFCATYTTTVNTEPTAIPDYLENCASNPSAVSSACSCLVASQTTSSSSTSSTESTTSTTVDSTTSPSDTVTSTTSESTSSSPSSTYSTTSTYYSNSSSTIPPSTTSSFSSTFYSNTSSVYSTTTPSPTTSPSGTETSETTTPYPTSSPSGSETSETTPPYPTSYPSGPDTTTYPPYPSSSPEGYPTTYPEGYPSSSPEGYPTTYPEGYPTTAPEGYPTTYPGGSEYPEGYTTSTVYTTHVYTITKCPPTVKDCPYGHVTTETVALYTTVCPIGETTPPPPAPTSYPAGFTTSTVYTTHIYTISKCPPSVTNCPYGTVTTETVALYTTVCPVAEQSPETTTIQVSYVPLSVIVSPLPQFTPLPVPSGGAVQSYAPTPGTESAVPSPIYPTPVSSPAGVATYAPPPPASSPAGIVTYPAPAPPAGTPTYNSTTVVPSSPLQVTPGSGAGMVGVTTFGTLAMGITAIFFLL